MSQLLCAFKLYCDSRNHRLVTHLRLLVTLKMDGVGFEDASLALAAAADHAPHGVVGSSMPEPVITIGHVQVAPEESHQRGSDPSRHYSK